MVILSAGPEATALRQAVMPALQRRRRLLNCLWGIFS